MATSFTSLPIIDLGTLDDADFSLPPSPEVQALASQLHDVFATSGFAYLTHLPISFSHDDVFALSKQVFGLSVEEKMRMAKKTFAKGNENTYRG
jgi:isopenicillin N synthase-like dioxygenase